MRLTKDVKFSNWQRNLSLLLILLLQYDLKSKSSSGPDCLSSKLLKEIILDIAKPLSHVFNLSFKTGVIPEPEI